MVVNAALYLHAIGRVQEKGCKLSPRFFRDPARWSSVQGKIGYHEFMRRVAPIRVIVLAVFLAASNLVFASHVASHISSNAVGCEWCVCHVQTLAGPLPSAEPVHIERLRAPLKPAGEIAILSQPVVPGYQPRAPPISS
jgi:hypothetical protein